MIISSFVSNGITTLIKETFGKTYMFKIGVNYPRGSGKSVGILRSHPSLFERWLAPRALNRLGAADHSLLGVVVVFLCTCSLNWKILLYTSKLAVSFLTIANKLKIFQLIDFISG